MLNTLKAGSALPDNLLTLKKSNFVILLRNMDALADHVHDAQNIVKEMTNNVLFLRLVTGTRAGARLCIPRMPCEPAKSIFAAMFFKIDDQIVFVQKMHYLT